MATSGEFQWPPLGKNRWPLTIDASEAARRAFQRGEDMPPEVIAWWVRQARDDLGAAISDRAYRAWRKREGSRRGCCIPCTTTVIEKLEACDFRDAVGKAISDLHE
jgi:hypothetical protein